jgi:hypothetical protein
MPRKPTGNKVGRPRKTTLNKRQREALEIDYKHIQWGLLFTTARKGVPSLLPSDTLAQQMGVGTRTIQKWRSDPLYRSELIERFMSNLNLVMGREDHDNSKSTAKFRKVRLDRINRTAALDAYVAKYWNGPVKSPIDGSIINTPMEWLKHLQDNHSLPHDIVRQQLKAAHEDYLRTLDPKKKERK